MLAWPTDLTVTILCRQQGRAAKPGKAGKGEADPWQRVQAAQAETASWRDDALDTWHRRVTLGQVQPCLMPELTPQGRLCELPVCIQRMWQAATSGARESCAGWLLSAKKRGGLQQLNVLPLKLSVLCRAAEQCAQT